MAATDAPPYVSLAERLLSLGETLNQHGGEIVPIGKIGQFLAALTAYIEFGDELLDQHELGLNIPDRYAVGVSTAYARVEPILTPERPEGWNPLVGQQMDPKDLEIERLKAQLASLHVPVIDPRDAELERLRSAVAGKSEPPPFVGTEPDTGGNTAALVAEIERLQQAAAAAGTADPTRVEVVHDPEYADYNREELKSLAERRGLTPEGTGSDGYVTVEDYRGALVADDETRQGASD